MDLSLTTDLESALLNWDVDEVHNGLAQSHNDHQHLNNEDGKHKNMISSTAVAAVTTTSNSHDVTTSLPPHTSLPKQHELLQQLNYHQQLYQPQQQQQHTRNFNNSHSGRHVSMLGGSTNNPISIMDGNSTQQSLYYQTIPSSSEVTTTSNSGAPNLYQHHVNTATHQNNTNLLLNGFVTALDNKTRTPTLQQSNYQVAQPNNTSGSSSASSAVAINGQTISAGKSSSPSTQVEQLQQQQPQQQRIPQHLQLDGVTTPFWHLQDSSSNNQSNTNVGTANSTAPFMERMFPPNYFLPGMVSCDPSQSHTNSSISSSTKVPAMDMTVGGGAAASFGEYGGPKSKTDASKSTPTTPQSDITPSVILALQQHHNQSNVNNTAVTPWGQQVPQHQSLQQNTMQISQTSPTTTSESIHTHRAVAAQNVQNSQTSSSNAVVDASMNCGTNNMSVHHQTMYNLNSLPIGSVITNTTNSIHDSAITSLPVGGDTGQQRQHISQSAPFQYITTDSNGENSPSSPIGSSNNGSGTTVADQKRQQQNPQPRSRATKKARTNNSLKPVKQQKRKGATNTKRKGDTNTTPPFYLFDAPCELRTNFIQAQQLNNITVVQDNNAYHYGMAVNGFHPQLNAQANPAIQPTSKIPRGSSSSTTNNDRVVLLDGRHKNKIRQGNERNEREQQRAQKITELIDKLRVTMVHGGWKKNEMKSKYQTLSTCAAYVKHLIQKTKEKEAAIKEAKLNLAIRGQKIEEDKSLQDSRSDPESVASSLTESSAYGSGEGQKGEGCVELGEKDGCNTSIPSARAISSSSGVGSDDNNNSNSSDMKKNDIVSDRWSPEEKNTKKTRVTIDGEDNQSGSVYSSGSGANSCNRKNGKRRSDWQNICIDNRCSSMSEISGSIQSSKGCSENTSDRGDSNAENAIGERETEDMSEASSISSTAAVMSGIGSKEQDSHANVTIKKNLTDRKSEYVMDREKTSLEVDFELNYQEVFLASNIPQLIATQTGRIAICNDFFHRATGMSEQDVQRITIFSIVQADKLSTLFELVATSLRRSNKPSSSEDCTTDTSTGQWTSNENDLYKTVTLPCIPFPKGLKMKSSENEEEVLCPLFMSVTFMSDDNPRNRCIHCIFTENGPTTNGKIGPITPQVLKKMFSGNELGPPSCNNFTVEKVKDEFVE